MNQALLNELNSIDSDIIRINCTSVGSVPHIVRGPRFNVPLLKRQVASLITMGFKIEILTPKTIVETKQETTKVLAKEEKVIKIIQEFSIENLPNTEEVKRDINTLFSNSIEEYVNNYSEVQNDIPSETLYEEVLEEKKEETVVEEVSTENSLDGMSKTKLKKLLKENNIEFENSDSIEVLKEKAFGLV